MTFLLLVVFSVAFNEDAQFVHMKFTDGSVRLVEQILTPPRKLGPIGGEAQHGQTLSD